HASTGRLRLGAGRVGGRHLVADGAVEVEDGDGDGEGGAVVGADDGAGEGAVDGGHEQGRVAAVGVDRAAGGRGQLGGEVGLGVRGGDHRLPQLDHPVGGDGQVEVLLDAADGDGAREAG